MLPMQGFYPGPRSGTFFVCPVPMRTRTQSTRFPAIENKSWGQSMVAKQKNNIEEKVIRVIHDEEGESGGTQIRILKWVIDGKESQTYLEKRQYRIQPDKSKYFNKAKGFTKRDLNVLAENWDSIAELMEAQ